MKRYWFVLLVLGLASLGCNLVTLKPASTPTPPAGLPVDSVATAVEQTLQAYMPTIMPSQPPAESTASPEAAVQPTARTANPAPASPTAARRPGELMVAYTVGGDIYLWQPGTNPQRLTEHGGARAVYLSSDAAWVAYTKNIDETHIEIWAARTDGSQDIPVVILDDLKTADPTQWLYPDQLAWLPGSHTFYYNNVIRMDGPGSPPANDLRMADVDSGQKTTLLEPGAGGRFYFSPDGQKLLLVQYDRFRIANADGSGARDLFTYPFVYTYSEWTYLPDPVWLANSSAFRVLIPPQDPLSNADEPTWAWEIPADGSPARQISQFVTVPAFYARPLIAPNGERITYQTQEKPGDAVSQLHIATIDLSNDLVLQSGDLRVESWSPDSTRVVVWSNLRQELQVASLAGKFENWPVGIKPFELRWVDAKSFLVLSGSRERPELYYGTSEGQFVRLASAEGPDVGFDFVK